MLDHPEFDKFINDSAENLLRQIKTKTGSKSDSRNYSGSVSAKPSYDISDWIVGPLSYSSVDHFNDKVDYWRVSDNQEVGFDELAYKEVKVLIEKLADRLQKRTTKRFLEANVLKWFFGKYDKLISNTLTEFLLSAINERISTRFYAFHIPFLEIEAQFRFAGVVFFYLTSESLDKITKHNSPGLSRSKDNSFKENLKSQYLGKVFVGCEVTAEETKATDIAYDQCAKAVDMLKVCSDTLVNPYLELTFDLDSRLHQAARQESLSWVGEELENFKVNYKNLRLPHDIDMKYLYRIRSRGFENLLEVYFQDSPSDKELIGLIQLAIRQLSMELSNLDLHRRIAGLFTVYEMLLVKGDSNFILESIKKYGSKLAFNDVESRKRFKELVTKMYGVRSQLIHHGKRKPFADEDLCTFQETLHRLILNLCKKARQHATKASVLNEIDERLERA